MESLNEDLDDSALICMTLTQKRKACVNLNHKNFKQAKLSYPGTLKNSENIESNISESFESSDKIECRGENEKQSNIQNCNSDWNESCSSYFQNKKSSNTCPLCLKTFVKESGYMVHMKQCAKKHKMTTQQLLKALELQKKQLQERRMLGLCSQIVPARKKSKKKEDAIEESQTKYDLALALALSKSLKENETKSLMSNRGTTNKILETPELVSNNGAGPSKIKNKISKKSILRERTNEERQRIITEKAAAILLDEDECGQSEREIVEKDFSLKNIKLTKFQSKVSHLWNLGENEGKFNWYVDDIKILLIVEEKEEMDSNNFNVTATSQVSKSNIVHEILKLNLPKCNVYQDWRKMINNEKFSDFLGKTKDGYNFYLHSLVLFARCPEVLEKDLKSIFENFNLSTLCIFSEFLYCGTLNEISEVEIEPLASLANHCDYKDLINVLNCIQVNIMQVRDEMIPSSVSPEEKKDSKFAETEVAIIDEKEELTIVPDKEDLFVEDMVDLTQCSHGSSTVNDNDNDAEEENYEEEFNAEKSYWSFLQHEKEREKLEELRKQEEEKESSEIREEMEKIETSQKQQQELMQQILNEFETDETNLKNKLELEKIYGFHTGNSNETCTKDLKEKFKNKPVDQEDDCIIISSDSETRMSKAEEMESFREVGSLGVMDFEVPFYDPYDHLDQFSPVEPRENVLSQSFLTGDVSFGHESFQEDDKNRKKSPEYCSTPLSNQRTSRINSSVKKSLTGSKKKRNNLLTNRIIRKSLGLRDQKSSSKKESAKKSKRKESLKVGKDLAEAITNSILKEFSKSPLMKSSTPRRGEKFIEITPRGATDIEFGETVTPSPNYGNMRDSTIKEQLSKYGLKRNLGKTKAKKILQYIYEELHPIINIETGKLVKMPPKNKPKARKNTTKTSSVRKESKPKLTQKNIKKLNTSVKSTNSSNNSKVSDAISNLSYDSSDKSTDFDSIKSEFEDIQEPLTQSLPNNLVDLPSAFNELLCRNQDFHQKILLYEPIWLEDLQKKLKETFKKHFKLSDLMDYLDQKCITFRSVAQKKNNQKRNERMKTGPKERKSS